MCKAEPDAPWGVNETGWAIATEYLDEHSNDLCLCASETLCNQTPHNCSRSPLRGLPLTAHAQTPGAAPAEHSFLLL